MDQWIKVADGSYRPLRLYTALRVYEINNENGVTTYGVGDGSVPNKIAEFDEFDEAFDYLEDLVNNPDKRSETVKEKKTSK